ncbi:MAG: M4 family metallopeptidase [Pseudomonadota bacterium]
MISHRCHGCIPPGRTCGHKVFDQRQVCRGAGQKSRGNSRATAGRNHARSLCCRGPHASTGELVTAIGRGKAEQVFYRALSAYMTPDTDFAGARTATMDAAMDLSGNETAQLVGDASAVYGVD